MASENESEVLPSIRLNNDQESFESEDSDEMPANDALAALPDDSNFRSFLKLGNTRRRHSWNVW